ncbi:MAG: translation elongation factor Ts [bacterium]|nr:translation elongation factor Ts [bacterium]
MANITASMVKELREKTGAGMMDCKKALAETDGDMEKAVDELRKRGQAIADKKGARATKEGLIFARVDGKVGAMVELNCETDFVARNDEFRAVGAALAARVAAGDAPIDSGSLADVTMDEFGGKPAGQVIQELIAKVGENMAVSRFVRVDASQGEGLGFVTSYVHPPGKLGVLVELRAGKAETMAGGEFAALAKDLAMQVAAAAPVCITRAQVPADLLERERAIYADQARMEGKPEKIWDKIIEGKMAKFYKESCLLEQIFVKDADLTIAKLLEATGKKLGDTLSIARFERLVVGGAAPAAEAAE